MVESESPTYRSWNMMKQRCLNKNYTHYSYYGGRGIDVCEKWLSYRGFVEDMGIRPEQSELDRIDNDKGYYKENCRWADSTTQAFNKRRKCTNTSGRTGVAQHKDTLRWRSVITVAGKTIHLGYFATFEEAVKSREEAELKYFGFIKEPFVENV